LEHEGLRAAVALEAGIQFKYARVSTKGTIPYARDLEDQILPSVLRIVAACESLMEEKRER
jgi:hypothetical protein